MITNNDYDHMNSVFLQQFLLGGSWDYISCLESESDALTVSCQFAARYFPPESTSYFMAVALYLSHRNVKFASSSPCVGCVYVQDHRIVCWGYTQSYQGLHGERHAIHKLVDTTVLQGSTVYVPIEPCYFLNKKNACADMLVSLGVSKVVISCLDEDKRVHGQGVKRLRKHGIEVELGILSEATRKFYSLYFCHRKRDHSIVLGAKWAQSLDGKLAAPDGKSQWISSSISRRYAQWLRYMYDGVMIGSQTFITDRPSLSLRDSFLIDKRSFERGIKKIVFDPQLKALQHDCFLDHYQHMKQIGENIIWITSKNRRQELHHSAAWKMMSAEDRRSCLCIFDTDQVNHSVQSMFAANSELSSVMGERISILVEGGARLHSLFIGAGVLNMIHMVISPKWLGGSHHIAPQGKMYPHMLSEHSNYVLRAHYAFEEDILCEYEHVIHS